MTNITNISLDSNLMREPQAFDTYLRYGGIARDVLIYAAALKQKGWITLNVPEFCKVFGYNRQTLLRALPGTKEKPGKERKEMKAARLKVEGKNVLDYAIFLLVQRNLLFDEGYKAIDENGTLTKFDGKVGVQLLEAFSVRRSKKGTEYALRLHPYFVNNCAGGHYTSFRLSDYLNITTATGEAWDAGRRLFLRMVWKQKRMQYNKTQPKKLRNPDAAGDSFAQLCEVAKLVNDYDQEKKKAAELRSMLDKVNREGNVGMVSKIELSMTYGQAGYQVKHKATKEAAAAE